MKLKFFSLLLLLCLGASCVQKTFDPTEKFSLVSGDSICFSLDDSTFYESKAMFQFEDKDKEYLFFQNKQKGALRVLIFDINKEELFKPIPLYKEGPNGIPAIWGGFPLDMEHFLITTNSTRFYIVNDSGGILFKSDQLYPGRGDFGDYCTTMIYSYYSNPGIIQDSIFYFPQPHVGYPHKKEDWTKSNLFAYADLRTGQLGKTQLCYPAIFDKDEVLRTLSYESGASYAYTGKEIALSFHSADSIYVSPNFKDTRAYNAKSRYFPHLHPEPYDATMDLIVRLRQSNNSPSYHHLLYDKYRKVFYRFALMPYEYPANKSPMEEDTGREFSVIILNENYEIVGETKFPGNKYAYRLWFIGKKGLYLSLNNQGNPNFDENELKFQCFTLEENK